MVCALDIVDNAARVDVLPILPAPKWPCCEPTSLQALGSQPIRLKLSLDIARQRGSNRPLCLGVAVISESATLGTDS